jgi:copper chaperone
MGGRTINPLQKEIVMLKLHIPDMTCGGCENKIRKVLAQVHGIDSLEIDRNTRLIQINGSAPEASIILTIQDAGFTVKPVTA